MQQSPSPLLLDRGLSSLPVLPWEQAGSSWFQGCPVLCRLSGTSPALHPAEATSTPTSKLQPLKVSLDMVRCPLGKCPIESYCHSHGSPLPFSTWVCCVLAGSLPQQAGHSSCLVEGRIALSRVLLIDCFSSGHCPGSGLPLMFVALPQILHIAGFKA